MPTNPTVAADTPAYLPVAIAGHQYLVDLEGYSRDTVPPIRQQSDTSTEPGEASLTPQGLWRRSQESFHHGAGQPFLDGRQGLSAYNLVSADPHRWRTSKGVDPWTRGQLCLLHPTLLAWSTTNTNLYMALGQNTSGLFFVYVADGTNLYFNSLPYNQNNSLALLTGTGWTPTNATIAASNMDFTLTGTAATGATATSPTGTGGMPVDANRQYGFNLFSTYVSGGSARIASIQVNWYNAAGTLISSTPAYSSGGTDTPNSLITQQYTAPSTAAFASLTIAYTGGAVGEIHRVGASFGPYDDLPSSIGYPFRWSDSIINAGQPAQPVQALTTDGSYMWAALGTSGIHRTAAGAVGTSTADVPAAPGAGQISLVGFANGRLLAAGSVTSVTGRNVLWEVTDPLGTPALAVLMTHPNPNFAWTFVSPGRNCVYAGGNCGGNAEVYRITLEDVSTALAPPIHATYLPDGETIHALAFYAGWIIIGTGKGLRLGQADGQGNIDYGPLIPTLWPVRCFEPQDRYCWFGWTKYDGASSGLGRVDLGFLTDTLTPAWASDLMAAGTQGDVIGAITMFPYGYSADQRPPVRMFSVAGVGVYIEDAAAVVGSGQFETGSVRYSTSETKMTRAVDLTHHILNAVGGLPGTVGVELKVDDGSYVSIGTSSSTGSSRKTLSTGAVEGEAAELRLTLTRSPTSAATGPELTRWTLKALPLPHLDEAFTLPIIMKPRIVTDQGDGSDAPLDVAAEISFLKGLERYRTVVSFQVGAETLTGYIDGSQQKGAYWGPDGAFLAGTYVVRLVTCE